MNIVVLSYEFVYQPFSGNGILARSLVKSLLQLNYYDNDSIIDDDADNDNNNTNSKDSKTISITVWCCRPPSDDNNDNDNLLQYPEITQEQCNRLQIISIPLTTEEGWYRLDKQSAYRSFCWDRISDDSNISNDRIRLTKSLQCADSICIIDWTGASAYRTIPENLRIQKSQKSPILYFNFRVYSSGITATEDHDWYDTMEYRALCDATTIIALSIKDQLSIQEILQNNRKRIANHNDNENNQQRIHILYPPLRGDIEVLAKRQYLTTCDDNSDDNISRKQQHHDEEKEDNLDQYLPPEVVTFLSQHTNKRKMFITCLVRLSPEKNTRRFVDFLIHAKDLIHKNGYVPVLIGASSCSDYSNLVKQQLLQEFNSNYDNNCIIIESFLSSKQLAAILSYTIVNIHPCSYDAYGMTIIEAAALGVPSIVGPPSRIGAVATLQQQQQPNSNPHQLLKEQCHPPNALQKDQLQRNEDPKQQPDTICNGSISKNCKNNDTSNYDDNNCNNGTKHDGCILVDIPDDDTIPLSESTIQTVRNILQHPKELQTIGLLAKSRALLWDEKAYGKSVLDIIQYERRKNQDTGCPK